MRSLRGLKLFSFAYSNPIKSLFTKFTQELAENSNISTKNMTPPHKYLSIGDEEHLIICKTKTRGQFLGAIFLNPFLVSLRKGY